MRPGRDLGLARKASALLALLVLTTLGAPAPCFTRAFAQDRIPDPPAPVTTLSSTKLHTEIFRFERVPVESGAELITIKARLDGLDSNETAQWVPLVTVLRDTLGDLTAENDRLRYVWPLTYTRPTLRQRVLGAVPFLYMRAGNRKHFSGREPPPVLDLAAPDRDVWNKMFWTAIQNVLIDPYGTPIKASSLSYQRNIADYRKSHIVRALSVLSLYEALDGPPVFSAGELSEIEARLRLTDKTFGGLIGDLNLQRYYQKEMMQARDERGHNWELLRQRAEAESLFFEPLEMPDGSTTHVMLWVAKPDLESNQGRRYEKRFLNISSPWSDKSLLSWNGYTETRYFDGEHRPVSPDTPGAQPVEMIPLALYGLDYPKIPMVLVDFRDSLNPKKREMSRRVIQDLTRNVMSGSRFGDPAYFLGRSILDFVTGKRGMDVNQPSRLRTYSQLKLLLSLNQSLDPGLRNQIGKRLERVSLNPLENDLEAEAQLAQEQYAALLAYAKRPDGLAEKLKLDRRAELVPLRHGRVERVLFQLANVLTLGKYTHREKATPEMEGRLDLARRFSYHTRFLREVARSSPQLEVTSNLDEVNRSLRFIADHAKNADAKTAVTAARIFLQTQDSETRRNCLEGLTRMSNAKAKSELLRISQLKELDQSGKDLISAYLNGTPPADDPLAASSQKTNAVDQ